MWRTRWHRPTREPSTELFLFGDPPGKVAVARPPLPLDTGRLVTSALGPGLTAAQFSTRSCLGLRSWLIYLAPPLHSSSSICSALRTLGTIDSAHLQPLLYVITYFANRHSHPSTALAPFSYASTTVPAPKFWPLDPVRHQAPSNHPYISWSTAVPFLTSGLNTTSRFDPTQLPSRCTLASP